MLLYESVCMVLFSLCFIMLINCSLYGMDIKPSWYYGAAGDMKKKSHPVQLESFVHENLKCKVSMQLSKIADKYMIFHSLQKVHSPYKDKTPQHDLVDFLRLLTDIKKHRVLEIKKIVSQNQLNDVVKRWRRDDQSLDMQIQEKMNKYQPNHNKKKKVHPNTLLAVQALEKTLSKGV